MTPLIPSLHTGLAASDDKTLTAAANEAAAVDASSPAGDAVDARYRARAEAAAEKFEAFFISMMLKQMRSVTRELADEDSVFRSRINQDMLEVADGKLAEAMAGQRAFGIADVILRQLLPDAPVQPVAVAPPSATLSRR